MHQAIGHTAILPAPGLRKEGALEVSSWAGALEREPQTWAPDLDPGRNHPGTRGGLFRGASGLTHLIPWWLSFYPLFPLSSTGSLLPPLILVLPQPVAPFPVNPFRGLRWRGHPQLSVNLWLAEAVGTPQEPGPWLGPLFFPPSHPPHKCCTWTPGVY